MTHEVINHLYNVYRENKFSHAYLIETNNLDKCLKDIKHLIKLICCKDDYNEKCTKCNMCHLIDSNLLPSLKIIEPDGKYIKKEPIDELKSAFSLMPAFTDNNIYIIVSPEKMNDTAYNKMLKFVEEPEKNIIGFYITNNKNSVPATIISRLEGVKIYYEEDNQINNLLTNEKYNELLTLANELINNFENKKENELWFFEKNITKSISTREEVVSFLKIIYTMYENEFKTASVIKKNILIKQLNVINKYIKQLSYNVNLSLLINSFCIEMGELYGL